jgi:EAL domain-containing protein (putative c-di-GMP-specific phosphodiesterase class I)
VSTERITELERDELRRLRAEWLQYRSRLHDSETGLPTLSGILDDLRHDLEGGAALGVFTFSLNVERQMEEVWGWQAYDRLVVDFIQKLKADRGGGRVPEGVLCLPAVRSDEIFLFVSLGAEAGNGSVVPLDDLAADLNGYVRDFLQLRFPKTDRHRSYIGSSSIVFDPKVRVERLIYRALHEARGEAYARSAKAETRVAESLRRIISNSEITAVFQPIFELPTMEILAFEALSRGPAGSGFEDGESLFGFAERSNLLLPLERACRRRILEDAGPIPASQLLFINLSPAAASDNEFLEGAFEKLVREKNFEPSRIVLEITERTYALNQQLFTDVLSELRREGFQIAVDDMGTGYSSFSSLAEIAPNYIKFDSVFVHEIHRHRIKRDLLDAMLSFAQKTGTHVIAEGIETQEELDTLLDLGVPFGQGFLLARPGPLPAEPTSH